MRPVICDLTGKRTYVSEEAAKRARARYRKRDKRRGYVTDRNIRGYECEFCEGWHNTSMPLSTYRQLRRRAAGSAGDSQTPSV